MMVKTFLAVAAGVTMASAASAATVHTTFDLTATQGSAEYGDQGNAFSLTQGGLTATFSAHAFKKTADGKSESISNNILTADLIRDGIIGRWETGVGTKTHMWDSHQVDGGGQTDYVQISFSQSIMITEVAFSYFHEDTTVDKDDFRWMYDLSGDGAIGTGDWVSDNVSAQTFSGFGAVSSDVYGFGAFDANDFWKLKSISVKFDVPGNNPPPVPLPAGGALLIGALAAFAGLRRTKAVKNA